ncbi:hypothetical protein N780_06340 [Pontibacillus chungwhensis BH030062]|uniref:Uncharacterized protein n=1 Tax=Pontibacillus chungwhensis BH030062 TaxID=1385513 RepID=A0A0A2UQJ4_9BACI|nr:hypothetical protein [Pontibacillus chungwhensis]KGP90219.1 hypothetical protein N780_06340 [Pontibacillus chungwhensis BH030062]
MKSKEDDKAETKHSQYLRYVIICILIVAVGLALMVQNNWMEQINQPLATQSPLLASRQVGDGVEVTLTTLKEEQPYLVVYSVNRQTYSFTANAYMKLDEPIQEIRYSKGGELWIRREREWILLSGDLKPISSSTTGPSKYKESPPSIKEVTQVGDTFQATVEYDHGSEWSSTFTKRPLEVERLPQENVWVVLLEDFVVKIVKN